MAERVGFEPTRRLPVWPVFNRLVLTTHPPLVQSVSQAGRGCQLTVRVGPALQKSRYLRRAIPAKNRVLLRECTVREAKTPRTTIRAVAALHIMELMRPGRDRARTVRW